MIVAVFYGGRSCEHDVSVITGVQAAGLLHGHEVIPVYVDRDGKWLFVKDYDDLRAYSKGTVKGKPVFLKPGDPYLYIGRGKRFIKPDVALLCNHGAGGEDGTLQGALQLSGIAYTGSGVAGSAAGMDKRMSKRLFALAGLPVVNYIEADRYRYENELKSLVGEAKALGYPLIVKPASLGSSIGVRIVQNGKEFISALNVAFEWDNAVIAEKALEDFTELNCAVVGGNGKFAVSEPEKPFSSGGFLSYRDKYEGGGFKGEGSGRQFPANIDGKLRAQVRLNAAKAFKSVAAGGIARVDFLYDNAQGNLYVNEINTIPGSLALYLFPHGLSFESMSSLVESDGAPVKTEESAGPTKFGGGSADVLNELLRLAVSERDARESLKYRFVSPAAHGKGI